MRHMMSLTGVSMFVSLSRLARLGLVGVATAVLFSTAGCSSTSSSDQNASDSRSTPGVQQAYGEVLEAVDEFEGGAESAAQEGGPIGLADFAIANGNLVLNAATALNDTLAQDPSAAGFPEPELIQQAADAATSYGRSLSSLGSRLDACSAGDNVCYEAAYAADTTGSAARADFRSAVQAIQVAVE